MSFNTDMKMTPQGVAKITLSGRLDSSAAQQRLEEEIQHAVGYQARRLALLMQDLEYMSDVGPRVLVSAAQQMGSASNIYVVGAQGTVREEIEMTGLQNAINLLDEYDPAVIEAF